MMRATEPSGAGRSTHMKTRIRAFIIGLAVPLALIGCDLPFDTSGDRVVGILVWVDGPHADIIASPTKGASSVASDSLPAVVSMPDTVQAGVPFGVTVATIGATSCWKADGAEVEVSSDVADIVLFDVVDMPGDGACADVV